MLGARESKKFPIFERWEGSQSHWSSDGALHEHPVGSQNVLGARHETYGTEEIGDMGRTHVE